jgi:two-component system sensor histidine kinase PilS (NtrC family)
MGYFFWIIFQDITEIKAQQERLKLIDRLAALGEMAAGLAHEIRNPLTSISGAAEFLNHAGLILPEGQRLIEIIQKESERLNKLTSSFLLYGRPEKKKAEKLFLAEEISSILILLHQRKKLANADVDLDIPKELCLTIDPDMFRQVMLNILLNAFQAIPEGHGKIMISAGNSDHKVHVSVKDNGKGIDSEAIKKIFDPFFTTKPEGTGLGLSIVHRIVTELGGQIAVQSTPGKGTSFDIVFPQSVQEQ